MRVALDINVLAYAEGVNGAARQDTAVALLRQLPEESAVVPVQALGARAQSGLAGKPRSRSNPRRRDAFALAPTTEAAMISTIDLAADQRLGIWGSLMVSVATDSGCRMLLSEDLQDGFSWRGVTIVNPFSVNRHPFLEALLAGNSWSTPVP